MYLHDGAGRLGVVTAMTAVPTMTEGKTLLRIAALAAMWGSSFFWIKLGLAAFTPVQLVLIRLVLGALVLGGLCLAYRDRLPGSRRVWAHLAVAT